MSASSSSSNDPANRVPLLGGNSGGTAYSPWRELIRAHIMRQGLDSRDYEQEIRHFVALVTAVDNDAQSEEDAATELLLGHLASKGAGPTPSASSAIKQEDEPAAGAKQLAAKKLMAAKIARSRKAYAILHHALPAELRPLVADVPQGYAYGIWSFLEKRYRNTEQDSIGSLWEDLTAIRQEPEENFDDYKARVDRAVELLVHAKQIVAAGLYASIVLWRMQPRYATVVLTLRTGGSVADPDKIDWPAIAQLMGQYERAQIGLGGADGPERALAARSAWQSKPQVPSLSGKQSQQQQQRQPSSRTSIPIEEVECYYCHKKGHYKNKCPKLQSSPSNNASSRGKDERHPSKRRGSWSNKNAGDNSSEDESERSKPIERANMIRTLVTNRFGALDGHEDIVEQFVSSSSPQRSYAALALAAVPRAPVSGPAVDAAARAQKAKAKSLDEALKTTAKAVDTAATVSTTCCRESLHDIRRCVPMPIRMADGTVLSAMHKGKLTMRLPVAGKSDGFVKVTIDEVYYHERFDANLLSWGKMRVDGWELHSTPKGGTWLITPGGKRVNASTRGGLTILEDTVSERVYGVSSSSSKGLVCVTAKELLQLHRRLGHVSWTRLIEMCNTGASVGVGDIRNMPAAELSKAQQAIKSCSACAEAKAHRKPLGHGGLDKGTRAGEVIHMDTFYATTIDPISDKKSTRYCLLAVDAFTEWRWSEVKSSIADLPQSAIDMMEHSHTLTGRYPRLLISDLGSEFDNKTVREFCRKHGIQFQPSPARAKELNGLAEKNVDTMKNHVRAMVYGSKMPIRLGWAYAVNHYVYVWNRTHVGQHTRVTPYQSMTGREASVLNVSEFGCDVYIHQHRSKRETTFDRKAEPGIYFGHSGRSNCPMVLILSSGKFVLSKDVHFREGSFSHLRALVDGHPEDIEPIDLGAAADDIDATLSDMNDLDQPSPAQANDEEVESPRYELRSITDAREQSGVKQYRCKWVGHSAATWEPASTIKEDAPDAVREYESLVEGRAAAVQGRITRSQSKSVSFNGAASSSSSSISDEEESESESSLAAAYAARCL